MKKILFSFFLILPLVIFSQKNIPVARGPSQGNEYRQSSVSGFIENNGQIVNQEYNANPAILYLLNTKGMNVQLRKGGFSYDLYRTFIKEQPTSTLENPSGTNHPKSSIQYHRIDLDLPGCNPDCMIVTSGQSSDYLNYYTPGTPPEGITGVRSYQSVTYKDIYPGIDLEFHAGQDQPFEYDFIIQPGADPSLIRIKISGPQKIRSFSDGIRYHTSIGKMEETIPLCYYKLNGAVTPVKGKFKKQSDQLYGFLTEQNVPKGATLVIDPVPTRRWGTYYGGENGESMISLAIDFLGNIISGGVTDSYTNIATAGAFQTTMGGGTDAFFVKFNGNGQRQWGTYYGGTQGDIIYSVSSDLSGNIFIAGITGSTTGIASPGAFQTTKNWGEDAFIAKFNPSGIRSWGTYYGGNGIADLINSCKIDQAGNIYCFGETSSTDIIASPGAHQPNLSGSHDAFMVKFTGDGNRVWGTYYGGLNLEQEVGGCVTENGILYISGTTESSNNIATVGSFLPNLGNAPKGFLACFDTSGVRSWGTYLGGEGIEHSFGCVADTGSSVYLFGSTTSATNIATAGTFQPMKKGSGGAYLEKFSSFGLRTWGTYFGAGDARLRDASVDDSGFIYLSGDATAQDTLLFSPDGYQTHFTGGIDALLAKFSGDGQRIWSTYYGGFEFESGYTCATDNLDNIYLASFTWSVNHSSDNGLCSRAPGKNFISTPGSYQREIKNGDAYLVKFTDCYSPDTANQINGPSEVCANSTVSYAIDPIAGAVDYHWCLSGNLTIASGQNTTIINVNVGPTIGVDTISVYGINGCGEGFPKLFVVHTNRRPLPILTGTDTICTGDTAIFTTAGGKTNYMWNVSPGGSIVSGGTTTDSTVSVIWTMGGNQWISIEYMEDGCPPLTPFQKNVWVNGGLAMDIAIIVSQNPVCNPTPVTFTATPTGSGTLTYDWKVNGTSQGVNNTTFNYSPANGDVVMCVLSSSITACVTNNPATSNSITMVVTPLTALSVNISPSENPACSGNPITFAAVPSVTGPTNVFTWEINGITVGTNSASYTYNPSNGDLVKCQVSSSEQCITGSPARDSIFMTVGTSQIVDVTISASANNICAGTSVIFTATPVNPGATPVYLWKVNDNPQGINGNIFSYVPVNGDVIICKLTSSILTCLSNNPATSNQITMQVNPIVPVSIFVTPTQNNICAGTQITFTATPSGQGITPVYLWMVNGSPVGASQPTYSYIPANNDIITCMLTSSEQCPSQGVVTSAPVQMIVYHNLAVTVTLSASNNPVCAGIPVTFTATPVNGGLTPSYQWKVNGGNVGTNQNNYTYLPINGDVITCSMTTSISSCAIPPTATANPITMGISPLPVVTYRLCTDSITTTNAKPFTLKGGIPLGGIYSGPGVNSSTSIFNPSIAGPGTKTISYSYTNAGLCSDAKTKNIIVQAPAAFTCGNSFKDIRDNQVYQTVQIGTQCWFAENLDYGTSIPQSQHQRDNCLSEKYSTHPSPLTSHAFYQWDELMQYTETPGDKGLCPPGWHVPTEPEWQILFNFYSGIAFAASPLKSSGFSGFNAAPLGAAHQNTGFNYAGFATFFWTSTAYGSYKAWAHGMNDIDPSASSYPSSRANAFSVRCVKD